MGNFLHTLRSIDYGYRFRVAGYYCELKAAQFRLLPMKLRGALVIMVILLGAVFVSFMPARALTAELVPVSNISCTWAVNCSYTNVDEGSALNTADYIDTGTSGSGNEVVNVEMQDPVNVKTATSIQLLFNARIATLGSTADALQMDAVVGGVDLGAVQGTMTTSFAWYQYTYTGSWTQAQLNDMQFKITRIAQGSGSLSKKADDVQLASMYVNVTYTENSSIGQQAYRFYQNDNTLPPGGATFAKTIGKASTDDIGYSSTPTSDGGYVTTGDTLSFGSGQQLFIAKYDAGGNQVFYKTWGGAGDEHGASIVQTSDGGYAVGGYTSSSGAGAYDMLFVKFDGSGNFSYAKTWGGSGNDVAYGMVQTSDGGFALAGQTDTAGITLGGNDAVLVKLTSAGNLDFARTWGGAGQDFGQNVIQTSDGGYAIVGQTGSYLDTDGDLFLTKLTSTGALDFASTWGGPSADNGYGVVQTSDGGYVFSGYDVDATTAKLDAAFVKLTSTGALSKAVAWDNGEADSINMLTTSSDGGIVAAGETNGSATAKFDALLMKLDSSLNPVFASTFGGTSGDQQFRSAKQASDGGYIAAGETASYGAGDNDSLLVKYNSDGVITGCGVPTCKTVAGTVKTLPSPTYAFQAEATPTYTPSGTTLATVSSLASTSQAPTVTVITAAPAPGVGSPLAAVNTPAVAPASGVPFRLRVSLDVSNGTATDGSFKLQFAPRDTDNTCNNNETGYTDVTASSTIKYYDNSSAADGAAYVTSANDPTRSGITAIGQTYSEANPFVIKNSIGSGQDGLWDFALTTGDAPANTTYCIKAVNDDGSDLGSYANIAAVTTPPSVLTQAAYRWFDSATTSSSSTFGDKTDYPTGGAPSAVAAADFNGDGLPDLATANGNTSDNSVSILLGTGTGSFGTKTDFPVGTFPQAITTADFNGDGNADLAVTNASVATVSILLGTGTGSFGTKTDFPVNSDPYSIATADFNGDGHPDLAVANYGNDTVSILLGTGTGSFGTKTDFPTGGAPYSVAVADFNGDGKVDLATANYFDDTVSILLGTGTGSFGTKTDFSVVTGGGPIAITAADFNGDGHPDLAVANNYSNSASILLGTGTGSFGTAASFPTGGGPIAITAADIDGDGHLDLAVADQTAYTVSILLGTGTGSFGTNTDLATGGGPHAVIATDLNGDGSLDLAIPNAYDNTVSTFLSASLAGVGAPLADINTALDYPTPGSPIRLRLAIASQGSDLPASGQSFKLQYADKVTSCAVADYSDVTASSPLQWYDNPSFSNGSAVASDPNDPVDGTNPNVYQTYQEANNFTNSAAPINVGYDGLWDFSLTSSAAADGQTYCLRTVKADGSLLDSYSQQPEVTIGTPFVGPTLEQQLRGGQGVVNGVKSPLTF